LNRRGLPWALGFALLGACLLLDENGRTLPVARVFYTAGVSVYCTALVFYPARSGRSWLANLLIATSRWFGSVIDICMAQSLHAVPLLVVLLTAMLAVGTFALHRVGMKCIRPLTCAA